jgi:hypothetical protein
MALKDFTSFIKIDPFNRLNITLNAVIATAIEMDDSTYLTEDEGAGNWDKDFTEDFEMQMGAGADGGQCAFWSLSNVDVTGYRNSTSTGDSYVITNITGVNNQIGLGQQLNTVNLQTVFTLPFGQKNDNYYFTIDYVKSTDVTTLFIYSDSARTILLSTLTHDGSLVNQANLRYRYAVRTNSFPVQRPMDVTLRNLNVPINTTTVGEATAEPGINQDINVVVPYANDENTNNKYTIDYKKSSAVDWINWVTEALNTPSPYTDIITGLKRENFYDVRVTYVDNDGVTGTNPQFINNIFIPADPNKITTHNQDAKNRLLEQYKGKTGIEGLIEAYYGNQIQDLEDILFLFFDRLNIELSEGVQLDGIGKIINQDRLGLTDELYRLFIRARIGANVSESDIERIIDVWRLITQANLVKLEQIYPAEINLASDVALPPELIDLAYALIQNVSAAGVGVGVTTFLPLDSFAFDGADPSITKGFGKVISQGTTTGTTAFKLIAVGATFQTDGVNNTMVAMNDTDGTKANIISVDGEEELTLDADIFTTGEDYYINANTGGQLATIQGGA